MLTDQFYEYANANSAGTMSVYLKWPQLSKYKFLLPSSEEQIQIVSLFQYIVTAVEQAENQEKNLKELRRSLINKLTQASEYIFLPPSDILDVRFAAYFLFSVASDPRKIPSNSHGSNDLLSNACARNSNIFTLMIQI